MLRAITTRMSGHYSRGRFSPSADRQEVDKEEEEEMKKKASNKRITHGPWVLAPSHVLSELLPYCIDSTSFR